MPDSSVSFNSSEAEHVEVTEELEKKHDFIVFANKAIWHLTILISNILVNKK